MSYNDVSINSTNFNFATAKTIINDKNKLGQLRFHQYAVKQFFENATTRGLLLCHSMGQGKTRTAAAIIVDCVKTDPTRKIIVLSAKSLADNFKKELINYINAVGGGVSEMNETNEADEADETSETNDDWTDVADTKNDITTIAPSLATNNLPVKIKFISINSSIMFKQFGKIDKTDKELILEKKIGTLLETKNNLENSILVIDEAHNLFNAITNGAKNAVELYDLIMRTTNIKLIFMTGTPIINDPFELVPCFNMLYGQIPDKIDTQTLFSENAEEFDGFFVDEKKGIRNKEKFMNRITGLVSYYGDLYFSVDGINKPGFPKELPMRIEHVMMSYKQFDRYMAARKIEIDEAKRKMRGAPGRFSAAKGASSTYRVRSRQISNYCIPEYALGEAQGNRVREKFVDKIKPEDLRNPEFSPKMAKILKNLNDEKCSPKHKSMVYSQFVSGEGVNLFARILDAHGWQNYEDTDADINSAAAIGIKKERAKHMIYAKLTGEIDPDARTSIINDFNEKSTSIALLLISGAVAEGIDLKRVRSVHIMEPFWNYARINQVKTRAIRYLSHVDMPASEQNVQVYLYLSDYPEKTPPTKVKELTTDNELYTQSVNRYETIKTFIQALAEASFDCAIHHKTLPDAIKKNIKCNICRPTNRILYNINLLSDMEMTSPCESIDGQTIAVTPIEHDGKKYFWLKTPEGFFKIYEFDKKYNSHMLLPRTDPAYSAIMVKLYDISSAKKIKKSKNQKI